MGKIIILEGPDGGGKTTLAKEYEKLGWRYRHDGAPTPGRNNIAYYLEVLNEAMVSPQNTVFDRLWLGERMYGSVARGVDSIGEEGQRLFMRLHNSKDISQFICLPGIDTALENYEKKMAEPNDYLKSKELFLGVYQRYLDWTYRHAKMYERYDYKKGWVTLPDDKDFLPEGTVGSTSAEYLFIGDTPNHPHIDVPFHAITGSSGFFNQALTNCGIPEHKVALTNARRPDGRQHDIREILESLPAVDHIFLMGNKASEWFMRKATIPISRRVRIHKIPHPSYVKRFKNHNPWAFADLIKNEIENG